MSAPKSPPAELSIHLNNVDGHHEAKVVQKDNKKQADDDPPHIYFALRTRQEVGQQNQAVAYQMEQPMVCQLHFPLFICVKRPDPAYVDDIEVVR